MAKFVNIYGFDINPDHVIQVEQWDEDAREGTMYIHFNNGETKIISLKDYQKCCDILEALNKCVTTKKIKVVEV